MPHGRPTHRRKRWGLALALLLGTAGGAGAQESLPEPPAPPPAVKARDSKAELRALIEAQGQEIEALRQRIQQVQAAPAGAPAKPADGGLDADAVKKIIAQYLQDNPGAGMPPSVQTGFQTGSGFVIRSAPNPQFQPWADESRIPFELRLRGRIMLSYMNYKVTDTTNHVTNTPATQNANSVRLADFAQLEAKRVNLIFQGSAFSPDLRYNINLLGSTRGLPGFQNNKVVATAPAGGTEPNAAGASAIGGGVLLDHAVTLFEAWVAYDFHGCGTYKGCGPDCPDGAVKYSPTYTLIAGKLKPFFGLEEFLGNGNQQFVDFSMADWFFDADDDARLMGAGTQIKAFEDRFFLQGTVDDAEGFTPNSQAQKYPALNIGFWYDLGGSWNPQRKAWDLYGDCTSDIDYSCKPVVRVGGAVNLQPMDRRSLYGDVQQSRFFTMPGAPGGTRLINVLNGDAATPGGAHAVDQFDAYSYDMFIGAKYKGFSIENEWWVRDLDNFHTTPNGLGNIIYQDSTGANALFTAQSLLDYGMQLQGGYFLIPKKLEVVARWSWIRGESGDLNGLGTFTTVRIPGLTTPVRIDREAFRNFHEANEYTLGVNYFFRRHLLKWQTDVGYYNGGNPAGSGAAAATAGFVPGADGYLVRTQMQLAF
jgi:hypothetical protein